MNKGLKRTVALTLCFTMVATSGIVSNAAETEGTEEYNTIIDYGAVAEDIKESFPVPKENVEVVENIEKLDAKDTVDKDSDSAFRSCRLIIYSTDDMEFEDAADEIKDVQRLDDFYIVEYISPTNTEEAYNFYVSLGYEVEVDEIKDAPEGVENKDVNDNEVESTRIAATDRDKDTKDVKKIKKDEVVVAVLDTGLNNGEEIFNEKMVEGKNFIDDSSDYNDVNGHGTAMSKIILENQDKKLKGKTYIMPIKILNDDGYGTTLSAYKGIKYAIEKKVDVINLSASGVGKSKLLTSAINEAYNNGIPVIVSAGNDNKNIEEYTPANVKSAFTISASYEYENNYYKEVYSNFGMGTDYTTTGKYEYVRNIDGEEVITKINGTSVSAAFVTGYVALLKRMALSDEDDNNDILSVADVNASLEQSVLPLENKEKFGKGFLKRENIKLSYGNNEDEKLNVDVITDEDLDENIIIGEDVSWITNRDVRVRGLQGNWGVQVYINDDGSHTNVGASSVVGPNTGNGGVYVPQYFDGNGGGTIYVNKISDSEVQIYYDHCNITHCTPWISIYAYDDNKYHITNIRREEPVAGHWNSAQTQTDEEHYKPDEYYGNWVDVYCGIGAREFGDGVACVDDFVIDYEVKPYIVTYNTNGGLWNNGTMDYISCEYDTYSGLNGFGLAVGLTEVPKREGYIFKGWYFTEGNSFNPNDWAIANKNVFTDIVDYANRYPDLYNLYAKYDYNAGDLIYHMWNCGFYEGRTIADHPANMLDNINAFSNNYDYYRQILPPGKGIVNTGSADVAGKWILAHAIWEEEPGFSVTYKPEGGAWKTDKGDYTDDFSIPYNIFGYNGMFGWVGCDAPKKKGYIFKGWYFVNDDGSPAHYESKHGITDWIDYYNRYPDLKKVFTVDGMISIRDLNTHMHEYGISEGRSVAGHPAYYNDTPDLKYDDYKQLLTGKQRMTNMCSEGAYPFVLANQHIIAYAVWEEGEGDYNIHYDYNNGYGDENDQPVDFGEVKQFDNTPDRYTSATVYFNSAGGGSVPSIKTVKDFLGWDSDTDMNLSYQTYQRSGSSALDKAWNTARYYNENSDVYKSASNIYDGIFAINDYLTSGMAKGRTHAGSGDENNKSNYYVAGKDFKDLTKEDGTVINMTGKWKYRSFTLPSAPSAPADSYFAGWQGPDGAVRQPGEIYTPENDANITFTAIWVSSRPSEHHYNVVYIYNNGWGTTASDTYLHTWTDYHYKWHPGSSGSYTDKNGNTHHWSSPGWWESKTYEGDVGHVRYPTPPEPRTATLHFNDSEIFDYADLNIDVKTKKRFDGWNHRYFGGESFKDWTYEGGTVVLNGYWTRLASPLPTPTKPEYDFIGWEGPDGTIYKPGSTYTPKDDEDVTFTAIWRRNCGQVNYKPNGATTNNSAKERGKLYNDILDDTKTRLDSNYNTMSGAAYGDEFHEDGYVSRTEKVADNVETTTYYLTHDGDILNTKGDSHKMYSFQGWAPVSYAKRPEANDVLYDGITKFMNIFYDAEAVGTLGYKTRPKNISQLRDIVRNIVSLRSDNISAWNKRDKGNWYDDIEKHGIVDMYATWDEYPIIETVSFNLTQDEIKNLSDDMIYDHIKVTDTEDGKVGRNNIQFIYDKNQLKKLVEQYTGYGSITVMATDSVGNTTKKVIMIGLNNTKPVKLEDQGYARFISKEAYYKKYGDGGLVPHSVWYDNEDYKNEIIKTFANTESNTPVQDWYYTHEQVLETQQWIKNNGFGKVKRENALEYFYDNFKSKGCLRSDSLGIT